MGESLKMVASFGREDGYRGFDQHRARNDMHKDVSRRDNRNLARQRNAKRRLGAALKERHITDLRCSRTASSMFCDAAAKISGRIKAVRDRWAFVQTSLKCGHGSVGLSAWRMTVRSFKRCDASISAFPIT
jgi:hypothetical protein